MVLNQSHCLRLQNNMKFNEFKAKVHKPKQHKLQGDVLYRIERNISVRISYVLVKLFPRIRPTAVTTVSYLILLAVFLTNFWPGWTEMGEYVFLPDRLWVGLFQLLALYSITFLDKMDGEVARATNRSSQKGIYHDRGVHFLYPMVYYFTLACIFVFTGAFHFLDGSSVGVIFGTFATAILAGMLVQMATFFREARLLVADTIKAGKLHDQIVDFQPTRVKKKRLWLPLRILDYTTFMIYFWGLWLYVGLVVLAFFSLYWAGTLYSIHIVLTLIITGYKVFWSYPRTGLFRKESPSIN